MAWTGRVPISLNIVVWGDDRSCWTHAFDLLNSLFLGKAAPIPLDQPHFLAAQTCVLDRHAEERVLVLLVVGGKGVLVEQHQFRVIRAGFREVWKILSDRSD
jgi:hypothetical protein